MKPTLDNERAFLDIPRQDPGYRPAAERIRDYRPVEQRLTAEELKRQAARCMDCGTPFCHGYGCPLENVIPEFNAHVHAGRWEAALDILLQTNPFPEFTARICPALCEGSCVAGLNGDAVTIRQIELEIIEWAFTHDVMRPQPPAQRSGRRVAVIGSGPAGLAAAHALNRNGHLVTVFEQARHPGGLLRYGIPDFKLEKSVIERRVDLMRKEGLLFECGVDVGHDVSTRYLWDRFDAIVLACGARAPRDLKVPGRELAGVHFAMDFLASQNMRHSGEEVDPARDINARGLRVVVIGGGDTGSDCVGTAIRQGAASVHQLEILPKPPPCRATGNPWPQWPLILRESSSHKEGCVRRWSVTTQALTGEQGHVRKLHGTEVEWMASQGGRPAPVEKPGTEFILDADLVLLAMGFTGPARSALFESFGLEHDARGQVVRDKAGMTSRSGVFVTGDMASGASLVVRAIADGLRVAATVQTWLGTES